MGVQVVLHFKTMTRSISFVAILVYVVSVLHSELRTGY